MLTAETEDLSSIPRRARTSSHEWTFDLAVVRGCQHTSINKLINAKKKVLAGLGEMAQWIKCQQCKCKVLTEDPQNPWKSEKGKKRKGQAG